MSILNLISGAVGTVLALNGHLISAAYCIFIGAFFDLLDGFVAKILDVQSLVGKQLDSLADLITFGMVPASIMYTLIKTYETCPYRPYTALLIVIFSALRLAKFNVDSRQTDCFIGLPTPANAIAIATLPMILEQVKSPRLVDALTHPFVLPLLTMFFSYLLVANIGFIAFKFNGIGFQANKIRYFLIVCLTLLIAILKIEGVFLGVWFYIFCSLFSRHRIDQ
ncbi:CDP-diacylglycerol--serine O-phosphatidyltransferase [Cardinium endosymbiont of Tipula unca]|uniref:CDP-diacylglycerol--serine O-phosphatidyltransferase n=1 Tax=Cardinium endosymbiont of Tipula unca TaxID=3066216 RepID=UPI0030CDB819